MTGSGAVNDRQRRGLLRARGCVPATDPASRRTQKPTSRGTSRARECYPENERGRCAVTGVRDFLSNKVLLFLDSTNFSTEQWQ